MTTKKESPRYAIEMEFDIKKLEKNYKKAGLSDKSFQNTYRTVKTLLKYKGFTLEGKLFVGKAGITREDCFNALLYLHNKLSFFTPSLKSLFIRKVGDSFDYLPTLNSFKD